MHPLKRNFSSSGFTLVELAIVITIIGLLIGGVLKGQELLENARMTSVGARMDNYRAAVTTFRDLYKGLPGDIAGATNFITGCTAANNCINGNGNGLIDAAAGQEGNWIYGYNVEEPFQAWKQLALANLITGGIDTSIARVAGTYRGGTHVPTTPMGGQIYIGSRSGDGVTIEQTLNGIVIFMTSTTSGGWVGGPHVFSPSGAMKMDMKVDDGIALRGNVQSVSDSWTNGCGTTANGTNGYNPNGAGQCDMGFGIQ